MARIRALCIGDELLDGRIRDENAWWLADFGRDQGFEIDAIHIVGDAHSAIIQALEQFSQQAEILVVCGGMGPTADDITRDAAADWMGVDLALDQAALAALKKRMSERGHPFTPNNRRQALFPAGARVMPSEVGTAAGFALHKNKCDLYFLPGVPGEYRWFVRHHLLGRLLTQGAAGLLSARTKFDFFGIGESVLETKLAGIEALAADLGAKVSYLARSPIISVHLKAAEHAQIDELRAFILARLGKWLVAEGDQTLSTRLSGLLGERGLSVTSAESCTAGLVCARIAEVPGASAWFERGFVTYANEAKTQMLGVREHILEKFGAVSSQTACQMAAGARRAASADFALATTGFAGPSGGTPDTPVGTIHFALAAPDGVWHLERVLSHRSREEVLRASVYTAVTLLLWHLEARLHEHTVHGPFKADEVWAHDGVVVDDQKTRP